MVPDKKMAKRLQNNVEAQKRARIERLKKDGLAKCADALKEAIERNSTSLPKSVTDTLPPVPPASNILRPECHAHIALHCGGDTLPFPCQVVELATHFVNVRLAFDLSSLPNHLRDYLILFQELMLTCPVKRNGAETATPYEDVVRALQEDFVSLEVGLGMGNSTFGCDALSHIFFLWAVVEPRRYGSLCAWLADLAAGVIFARDRVLAVCNNLITELVELRRDGSEVVDALSAYLVCAPNANSTNDYRMGILAQLPFLRRVRRDMRSGGASALRVAGALRAIAAYIAGCGSAGTFGQLSVPPGTHAEPLLNQFAEAWRSVPSRAAAAAAAEGVDRAEWLFATTAPNFALEAASGRTPGTRSHPPLSRRLLAPISGVDSAYCVQYAPCAVGLHDEDFLPVMLFCELMSRTEGPLYAEIRGAGLAYDVGLSFQLFHQLLCFTLYECASPHRAAAAFYALLARVPAERDSLLSPFAIDTARSALLYKIHSARATAPQLISDSLRCIFKGCSSPDDEFAVFEGLDRVDQAVLLRAYERHFRGFLDPSARSLAITCAPSQASAVRDGFAAAPLLTPVELIDGGIDRWLAAEAVGEGRAASVMTNNTKKQ
eukprot:TRINITY_DN3644_c0_g1_i5.p1 TRINITY_DN3644_c0_g1~~TRINITY_DN3644_c0_g1_i5.p1  ORF type:complete len:605 (-),score=132.84 TRINITY_DN3644_c0_g1_i5:59-1873(-)